MAGIVERLVPDELWGPVLDELGSRGDLDSSRCPIDSVNVRALKRGI